ncbi:hypothetical protein FHK92_12305 [Pseudomonas brassicacearum subsp. neoaurantiaca]|uniref:Uncharacterized protein n=1 Tax=Pseudomonas brassicacearum subsp. neoaurantiaca TaxID=494916 RepID=A0A7V8UCG3_9PSED|nr:hypothetical protein [Pseudomonas brassicacearum subsp. neoaurantiaca]
MARELAPAGLRSGPLSSRPTAFAGFTAAAPPSGSKLPRHRGPVRPTGSILASGICSIVRWVCWLWPVGRGFAARQRTMTLHREMKTQAKLPAFILWRLRVGDLWVCRVWSFSVCEPARSCHPLCFAAKRWQFFFYREFHL